MWKLCKHTIKATTAFGVYVDGERERIPYEADAYLNQLSHCACDLDPRMTREHYNALTKKLLMNKTREDGLPRDGYNDGKKFPRDRLLGPEYNTGANAFYFHAPGEMETLA